MQDKTEREFGEMLKPHNGTSKPKKKKKKPIKSISDLKMHYQQKYSAMPKGKM